MRIVYMIYYSEHVAEAHIQTTVSEKMQRAPQIPAPRMMPEEARRAIAARLSREAHVVVATHVVAILAAWLLDVK